MRNFLSEKVVGLKPSGIRKFFDIASEIEGCISLGVGEPDFDTPWHIREEGIYSLEKGRTFYSSNSGLKELRIEICNYMERTQNLKYDWAKDVLVTVGGSEAIDLALRAICNPKDEIIVPEPCYVAYSPCVKLADGVDVPIYLKEENQFKLTKDELLEKITPKTKALILAYPNNPTGAVMTKEDLMDIAEVCINKDILVISDEIYSELTYDTKHVSIASLPGMKERTIVINGFSKAYAMTGWRLGFAVGPSEILSQMTKIHQFAIMCAPITSQFAAVEALKNGDNDIKKMRESYNQRRRFLVNQLRDMGFDCFEPYGAFYVFPSIKKFNLSSEEFCLKLLEEEKVVVVPGTAFGESGEGFIRISYAYSIEDLKKALARVKKFIDRIKKD